ncbi:MAG: hypothetical protein K9M45_09050, partial [Kiritimatiellales bacterium]|nr:hypothetical protein [Kiritimatiellales bacterium]
ALGQKLDQTLLDLNLPVFNKIVAAASTSSRVMIASGDMIIRSDAELPQLPDADIVFFGLWAKPESARDFGVMFCDREAPEKLVTFLQKPSPDVIRERSKKQLFMIDIGVWLLSERAVDCLMNKCGWTKKNQTFPEDTPNVYDLYGKWALHLGSEPVEEDCEVGGLPTAVVTLPQGGFYHFGTSSDMTQSLYELQNLVTDQTKLGAVSTLAQPRQFIQNAVFQAPLRREENHSLWVENSFIPASWKIASRNVLTGIPENDWTLELEDGVCLDLVPVEETELCIRPYGYADAFRGAVGDSGTQWINRPLGDWLAARKISLADAGIDPATDIQTAPLFPVPETIDPAFIQWMFAAEPEESDVWRSLWLESRRLSARELGRQVNLGRLYAQRNALRETALPLMARNCEQSIFYKLDLENTAKRYAASPFDLPAELDISSLRNPMIAVHDRMFRAAVLRRRGDESWRDLEKETFGILRDLIVRRFIGQPSVPACTLLDDQIVWGRSPIRLDFAGGWTDTPPYCLEHGGQVLNIAIDLNGQPPIQVYARRTAEHELVIRSIDLGLEERLKTYEDVRAYDKLGSGFTVARAAFALVGFHPDFNGGAFQSLEEQLQALGGGVEITMLAAIPKGSGLGTSSILAATILGVLSDFGGLNWDKVELAQRTLALEQMLTSGGGWQDQVGGLFHGVKLVETTPGLEQVPVVRWLPGSFFSASAAGSGMLLYYTGITRVANDILGEIVRGIFLNSSRRLATLKAIGDNAAFCYDVIQRNDRDGFAEAIRRSWQLNNELDSGTNTPEVQRILDAAGDDLSAAKLLGAGGGGYLFMMARDADAAGRIRHSLGKNPPNSGARFVDFSLSETGLQITRS